MSTLLYGWGHVQRDEAVIRSTTDTVDKDAPAETQAAAPDFNQIELSGNERGGLSPNQLSSHVVPTSKYVPLPSNTNTDFAAPINHQVSSSGTAAAREQSGYWGHGTMQIAEGIQPQIYDGMQFKEEYFTATKLMPQGTTTDYLVPPSNDPVTLAMEASLGRKRAAQAQRAGQYSAWVNGTDVASIEGAP